MSYIVAFVKFSERGQAYPVDCLRTDLVVGDTVLVRMGDRRVTQGSVMDLRYLNWECKGLVLCKVSEGVMGNDGELSPPTNAPIQVGLASRQHLHRHLVDAGWKPIAPPSRIYRNALTVTNQAHKAQILLRKNGVDLELWDVTPDPKQLADGAQFPGYRSVHHHLPQTTFNLFEGIARFSASFLRNEGNYDRYFKPVGTLDRRTAEMKARRAASASDEMDDIYSAASDGSGGPAYLGDGIWIGSGGNLFER